MSVELQVPRLSVFIATSVDGFIADRNDSITWLEDAAGDRDYGFDHFVSDCDALALGRATYDHLAHAEHHFAGRPTFVFTRTPRPTHGTTTFWDKTPREALHEWAVLGLQRVYVDGGELISSFLGENLIDDMVITQVPVLLGKGRHLFVDNDGTADLHLHDVQPWPNGLVTLRYSRR
jgi:dihydrofolate reductase